MATASSAQGNSGAQLYEQGKLSEAITALGDAVRAKPTDREARGLLAELLCAAGNLDRADKQLDVLANQDLEAAVGISMFRQQVRAEMARKAFFESGAVPEFLGPLTPAMSKQLEANVAFRAGDAADASALLAEADKLRPPVRGTCNGTAFEGWRDLDDLCAGCFEVLTSNGKYYWVPVESVISMEFESPERPRDLVWRTVKMDVRDGPEGVVFIPAIYPVRQGETAADECLLGRATDWLEAPGAPVRGVGLRSFLAGADDVPIMDITTLEFDAPA